VCELAGVCPVNGTSNATNRDFYMRLLIIGMNGRGYAIRSPYWNLLRCDIITHAKFCVDQFRGFGVLPPPIFLFSIGLAGRPYNSIALPCYTVIGTFKVNSSRINHIQCNPALFCVNLYSSFPTVAFFFFSRTDFSYSPGLLTATSEHIRFYFFVFIFYF